MSLPIKRWIGPASVFCMMLALAGCNGTAKDEGDKPAAQTGEKKDNLGKPVQAQAVSLPRQTNLLSFNEAVLRDPPSEEDMIPPDVTCTGKNTGKLFESIANGLWDKVLFTDNAGRSIKYHAVLTTELGEIHVDLLGDIAPNHVRNFVCLTQLEYYDGMKFYYGLNTKVEDNRVAYIETGCPRGTGESGSGSIGYWLKPEISDKVTHEEGVLGACLNGDPNSAGCRFYITAATMPQMDGLFTVFGKVTRGLDIVRTINTRALDKEDRLEQPVLIRNVRIHTTLE